jgi:hypothetical protein
MESGSLGLRDPSPLKLAVATVPLPAKGAALSHGLQYLLNISHC